MKPITPAQESVARLSMEGYSLREIAAILRISFAAAKSRRAMAREKMGVNRIRGASYEDLARARQGTQRPLTVRQIHVLQKLTEGKTYHEIGRELKPPVKAPTVKNHVRAIREKLGANDTNQAVAEGFRRGILS